RGAPATGRHGAGAGPRAPDPGTAHRAGARRTPPGAGHRRPGAVSRRRGGPMNTPGKARGARGFTLIEVLVALGVVALALATGLQASNALTRSAERQTEQWLATLCAENALTALRLQRQLPGTGESDLDCTQAGHALRVH